MGLLTRVPKANLHGSCSGGGAQDSSNDAVLGARPSKLEHQMRGAQEQVSDGPSHVPAVPKAVQMLGLTAYQFYQAVISAATLHSYTSKFPQNKDQFYQTVISATSKVHATSHYCTTGYTWWR